MNRRVVGIALLVLLLTCTGYAQKVRYNSDQDAPFSEYKTYRWVDIDEGEQIDELTDRQIRAALDAELATKGLTRTEADSSDLCIGYQVAIKNERSFTSYNSGWGYGPGWRAGRWGGGTTTGQTSTISIGTLVLDIYDAKAERLGWRGEATKTLNPASNTKKREKNLATGVQKLLKNYPPPQK